MKFRGGYVIVLKTRCHFVLGQLQFNAVRRHNRSDETAQMQHEADCIHVLQFRDARCFRSV